MTLPEFYAAFDAALAKADAALMYHAPQFYPTGDLLRVIIKIPQGYTLPPAVDPIGLVYFVHTGHVRGILDWVQCAADLGIEDDLALSISEAADKSIDRLHAVDRDIRIQLLEILNRYALGAPNQARFHR